MENEKIICRQYQAGALMDHVIMQKVHFYCIIQERFIKGHYNERPPKILKIQHAL